VDLKGTLAEATSEAKRFKITGEKKPKAVVTQKTQDLYIQKTNKGISERTRRDEIAWQAAEKSLDNSEAKLREKAKLYEKMGKFLCS
jgi:hypothetical protein